MRIGIMGGTFDPIHIGHLLLGEFAYEQFHLDEVWFLPNGNPPHKEVEDTEEALAHRVEMVRLAVRENPHFQLSLHEAKKTVILTRIKLCRNSMRCILRMNISLFLERILSFPSNNGNISKRFFHPVPFWQQCGMIKILLICSVRFSIWKRITRQRSNFYRHRFWRFHRQRSEIVLPKIVRSAIWFRILLQIIFKNCNYIPKEKRRGHDN